MREGTTVSYFASDHLSSGSIVMSATGTLLSENRYMPFGEVRTISGHTEITETDFGYTGQRNYSYIKLIDYGARWYDPALGRFLQPDTIIPGLTNSQAWNRYSYVENSPIIYIDPSGFWKVIIIFGGDYSEKTNSFEAAAETIRRSLLEQGYNQEDIFFGKVTKDDDFFDPIKDSDVGEIEQVFVVSHGWKNGNQLSSGTGEPQLTKEDFGSQLEGLSDRFADDAEMNILACKVGKGWFGGKNSFGQYLSTFLKLM